MAIGKQARHLRGPYAKERLVLRPSTNLASVVHIRRRYPVGENLPLLLHGHALRCDIRQHVWSCRVGNTGGFQVMMMMMMTFITQMAKHQKFSEMTVAAGENSEISGSQWF